MTSVRSWVRSITSLVLKYGNDEYIMSFAFKFLRGRRTNNLWMTSEPKQMRRIKDSSINIKKPIAARQLVLGH